MEERPDLDRVVTDDAPRFPEIITLLKTGKESDLDKVIEIVAEMEKWEAMMVVADMYIQIKPWQHALFLMGYITGEMNKRFGTKQMKMITPEGKLLMEIGKIKDRQAHLGT